MSTSPPILPDPAGVSQAVRALDQGELVGLPTETVYGLAADARNPAAVAKIYAAKGRPAFNPLIAHLSAREDAQQEGKLDDRARALAEAWWPGPLTLVVPVGPAGRTCELARAGLDTIGLRIPAHPLARALLKSYGAPLVAPSANPSGQLSPTRAQDVAAAFGPEVALVLDGGPCEAGIESSIVSLLPDEPPRLLRPGAISREQLEEIVGPLESAEKGVISAPGQLGSHYAPKAAVRLNAEAATADEVLLGFGANAPVAVANLSPTGSTVEAAANLYRLLRELDACGAQTIAVMPIPDTGLGEAINDRLRRAAAPRSQ
ncbi:MAG: L-threonylcarbamoyladenylate synthase [Pseudomonadota bacterium]